MRESDHSKSERASSSLDCEQSLDVAEKAISDPPSEARLVEIERIFDHAARGILDKAELAREYHDTYARVHLGQDVRNGPGRPGVISEMARRLAVPGRPEGARRKWLERALKIASISPSAKAAARTAGLDRYQNSLLEIAKAGDERDQLLKLTEIAARRRARSSHVAGKKLLRPVIRFPADRKPEVLAMLVKLAEEAEVELLEPKTAERKLGHAIGQPGQNVDLPTSGTSERVARSAEKRNADPTAFDVPRTTPELPSGEAPPLECAFMPIPRTLPREQFAQMRRELAAIAEKYNTRLSFDRLP